MAVSHAVDGSIEPTVRTEVEALHAFFVGWFSGKLDENAFTGGFLDRFDPAFILVPPAGVTLGLDALAEAVRRGHGSNRAFRIAIRNVQVRRVLDGHVLATYEEWQRNALASTPPDNARTATVLLRLGERMSWLHVHETWLPEADVAAGAFDF